MSGFPRHPDVCLLTDSRDPSGLGEHMLALAAGLRRGCGRIVVACPPVASARPLLERAAALGVETAALDLDGDDAPVRLAAWLRAQDLDVLHAHAGIGWEDLPVAAVARAAAVPVVLRTEHLPYLLTDPWQRDEHARMVGRLDRLVCVSESSRASHLAAGVPADVLAVIRNGIAPRRPRRPRAEVRAALGLAADEPAVLTVARFAEQKDHRTLLAAVPAILARHERSRFVWVGAGPLAAETAAAVSAAGLGGRVTLLGPRDDVPDLLAAADLFALPSRFEGLPLALLEAMAAGLPVVATRVGGTDEAVEHGRTGLLVEPGDPAALANVVSAVLALPDRGTALGAAGRARVAEAFSTDRMAREVLALYLDLLARADATASVATPPPRPSGPDFHPTA